MDFSLLNTNPITSYIELGKLVHFLSLGFLHSILEIMLFHGITLKIKLVHILTLNEF